MSSSAGALERGAAPAGWKSRSSTGTSERGVKPPPPLLGPSSRPPRNWTASATISTLWRLLPSRASHSRHSRRPSSATGRPLERKRAQFSPWAPQTVTSKKLGLSSHSPVAWFLRRVLDAIRSEHTDMPLAVERSSGSLVRLPVRTTRLMFVAAMRWLLSAAKGAWKLVGRPSLRAAPGESGACPADWAVLLQRRRRDPRGAGRTLRVGRVADGHDRRGGGAEVRRGRCARAQLDDPVAQDAVRDLQVVIELLEQFARPAELDQVVVRVGVLAHLVGRRARAPLVAP